MAPPVPPPRRVPRKEETKNDIVEVYNSSPVTTSQDERRGIIQVSAEVHSTIITANSEENRVEKRAEKKRKKIRRKGTFTLKEKKQELRKTEDTEEYAPSEYPDNHSKSSEPNNVHETFTPRRGSVTETISDSDSGKIKLIPLRAGRSRRRLPAGSATETLSEESDPNEETSPTLPYNLPPVPLRRKSIAVLQSQELIPGKELSSIVNTPNDVPDPISSPAPVADPISSPAPVPAPRSSISKSSEQIGSPYCTSSSLDYKDSDVLPNRMRKPKKKRKLRDGKDPEGSQKSQAHSSPESCNNESSAKQTSSRSCEKKKDEMACITVHSCEPLHLKHFNRRQLVRVHVMDLTTAKYKRSALGKMSIQPVTTSPFEYRKHRTSMPTWEEDLFLLEPLSYIASVESLLVLEVIDSQKEDVIAWAFLKPVAANGALNIGKTLRLQLYKPGKPTKDTSVPKGFQWWTRGKYSNYSSTIFITVNGVPSDMIIKPTLSEVDDVKENNKLEQKEDDLVSAPSRKEIIDSDLEEVVWSRMPSLSCKLPNALVSTLDTGSAGSMAVAYSHSGLYLACQVGDNLSLLTYKGKTLLNLNGHQGLLYCLQWTSDDKYLLSSSADSTACIWDVANKRTTPLQVLSHPSYVYSCCWLEESFGLIVTACYDKYIRLWKLGSKCPLQHLAKHTSPVNTVSVIESGSLVSGDNSGIIIFWKLTEEGTLDFEREMILREIKGKIINKLVVHSGKKKMLVHTRDSVLRMVDITNGSVIQWFRGGLNTRFRCDSCLCGCGSRVFATCEDGSTCCWDALTGQMIAIYTHLQTCNGAASIDFHPLDHYMAVASHSPQGSASLSIVKHDRESNGKEVGIVYVDPVQDLGTSSQSLTSSLSGSYSIPSMIRDSSRSSPITPSTDLRKNKRKEFGLFKALLGRKKNKKGETNVGYQSTEEESNVLLTKKEKKINNVLPTSGHDTRDHRLSDIIKRMDKILIAISSNRP